MAQQCVIFIYGFTGYAKPTIISHGLVAKTSV